MGTRQSRRLCAHVHAPDARGRDGLVRGTRPVQPGGRAGRPRARTVLLWNATNVFGFQGIEWGPLNFVAAVTTVSRYMKHVMWPYGVNPVVIPNGIPETALGSVDVAAVRAIRAAADTPCLAFKI